MVLAIYDAFSPTRRQILHLLVPHRPIWYVFITAEIRTPKSHASHNIGARLNLLPPSDQIICSGGICVHGSLAKIIGTTYEYTELPQSAMPLWRISIWLSIWNSSQYQTLINSSLTALGVKTPDSVISADTNAGGYLHVSIKFII